MESRQRMNSFELIFAISLIAFYFLKAYIFLLKFLIFRFNYDLFYVIETTQFLWLILVIVKITHKIWPCKLFTPHLSILSSPADIERSFWRPFQTYCDQQLFQSPSFPAVKGFYALKLLKVANLHYQSNW